MRDQVLLNPKTEGTTVIAAIGELSGRPKVALIRLSVENATARESFRLHGPEIEALRLALNAWAEQQATLDAAIPAGKSCPDRPCPIITARYCPDRYCPSSPTVGEATP